ncbi:beta galactosidase jelly roll domain-containing protein [Ekhidna sp.]
MKLLKISILFFFSFNLTGQKTKILNLAGEWKFTIGDREEYVDVDYDDSSWESIKVPSPWENEGFANYNGFAWYRYSFDGKDLKGFTNLLINLGYIDDVHEAYLNERLIGFKGSFPPEFYTAYNALNEYALPESAINRNGENVIAIKVYDLVQEGGIAKGNIGIYLDAKLGRDFHSLEGVWRFTTNQDLDWEKRSYDDQDWENIIVPSYWRSKHIKRSKGYGWYRKEFKIPEDLKDRDLYLVMGKIDDFDYTYVNGEIIGRTKDFLPFGESTSYDEFRIYKISKELLNPRGTNIIAVQVEDIGIDAGIYSGPIGLTANVSSKRNYGR